MARPPQAFGAKRLRRNALGLAALLCASLASPAVLADEIYGRIWDSAGRRALAGAEIFSNNCQEAPTTTDRHGFYRLQINRRGVECRVEMTYRNMASSVLEVYTNSSRTLADIEARRSGDRWLLIRR